MGMPSEYQTSLLGVLFICLMLTISCTQQGESQEQETPEFNGVINTDIRNSTPDWAPYTPTKAPDNAPNILFILYDDTGLAAWSAYGGGINMPTLDKIAAQGLTYTNWHTTALYSPTRSTLLTG